MSYAYDCRILIADDNESELEALVKIITAAGFEVFTAKDGEEALEVLRKQDIDLILSDLKMPRMGGEELMKLSKTIRPHVEVIIMTGHGTIEDAVGGIKSGAYDFIEKPVKKLMLLKVIDKAAEKQSLARRNDELNRMLAEYKSGRKLVGTSPNFVKTLELAEQVARSEATILIQGESGTGKDVLAEFIQKRSGRKEKPFVKMNCAAIAETLLESELFGYEKGAFTGALTRKAGRFEMAQGGTLFLDEVSEMSASLQAKLLRFIENGEFQRVGGVDTLKADVRIIAATNVDLEQRVREKLFREDLYYRLNVIQIPIPPLRERRGDIMILAQYFLKIYGNKNNKEITGFTPEAVTFLENYSWRGNVRELENVIERAVVLAKNHHISDFELPPQITQGTEKKGYVTFAIGTSLEEMEQRMIEEALKYSGGDKEAAAKLLGTSSRTIYRKVNPKADEPKI